ncbi:MAG TPA: phosphoribosylamine--glycine ligase [Methylomirabilota bacterium]|jgi:phosphoribosylamine--glycine ligase|nr:phosphoribosylamine--glycine ligase [Methylomirabilota bacterium]
MTDVLLVGGGGREHALAWKLAQSPGLGRMIAAPGNPGIAAHARRVPIKDTAIDPLVALAQQERPDLVVIGPEAPLALGLADRLRAAGLAVFGGSAAAARLESSKAFAKDLMARHRIPTARFGTFRDAAAARRYARELGAPLVVKADGLAAGKGVTVCGTLEEADRAIAQCLEARAFGDAGLTVVVEEFLVGEEASFFALSDGVTVLPLTAAQDHKTVLDGDRGPNTGGMGAYSPAPVMDAAMQERVMTTIVRPTIAAMAEEGAPYTGALFVGLMITAEGPKVIEFNCRFGDPECQAILPRLEDDLLALLLAAATGKGLPSALTWSAQSSVCVVMTSAGYPGSYETGRAISGVEAAAALPGVNVFHAGTALADGALVTAGGRVLGVQAVGADVSAAIRTVYAAVERIRFDGAHYRRDIGHHALRRLG